MKSERWQDVSLLFQAALECEPDRRAALLAEKCGEDVELRGEVEELLRLHLDDDHDKFMADVPVEISAKLLTDELAPPLDGRQIGAYKILREIGKGGMGVVCYAVRDDEFRKSVALKLVKRGMDSEEILARFRHERQILASLDHPNIARLLDGGTTDDGLPYFVMEYVEGEAIDKYCRSQRLSLEERLILFRKVCAAVSFAHQNLVVHRDLKPSNILVPADGEPKLLDFGIAKLLNPDLFPSMVAPTGLIMRPMTPDYASPEQVKGLPITTASDVYSLGVLLYELLTGQKPYQFLTKSPAEIERVVCEMEPAPPSAVLSSNARSKRAKTENETTLTGQITSPQSLKGDLDNILLRALRKESNRRYASVEQFSEDIRRHLAGLPVLAHENNFPYRARKFVRRHRIPLGIGIVFVLLISSFAVAFYFQARRAEQQRIRADLQRARAEKVSAFMAEIFKVADPDRNYGKSMTAREILDAGAARLERELGDEPETKAALLHTIAEVYYSLGLFDQAGQMFEKALALRRQVLGDQSEEVAVTLEQLGLSRAQRADYLGAQTNYTEALAIWQSRSGKHERISALWEKLGRAAIGRGDWHIAINHFQESLRIARSLRGDDYKSTYCHDSDRGDPCTERTISYLALALQKTGNLAEAEKYYRLAVDVTRRNNPDDFDMIDHRQHNLANFISDTRGDFAEAERLHREVLDHRLRLYGNDYIGVSYSRWSLYFALEANKKYTEAEFNVRETIRIDRAYYGPEHPQTLWARRDLGYLLLYQRKFDEAEKLLRETAVLQTKAEGGGNPYTTLPTRLFVAVLLNEKGDRAGAEKLLEEILPEVKRRYVAPDEILGLTLVEYAKVLLARGQAAQAEPYLREGWENLKHTASQFKWTSAEAQSALGECLLALRRNREAQPLLEEGLRLLNERLGDERKWIGDRARKRLAKLN